MPADSMLDVGSTAVTAAVAAAAPGAGTTATTVASVAPGAESSSCALHGADSCTLHGGAFLNVDGVYTSLKGQLQWKFMVFPSDPAWGMFNCHGSDSAHQATCGNLKGGISGLFLLTRHLASFRLFTPPGIPDAVPNVQSKFIWFTRIMPARATYNIAHGTNVYSLSDDLSACVSKPGVSESVST